MLKFITPRNVLITTGLEFLLTEVIFQIDSIQLAKDTFPKELLTHEGLRIAELMQEGLGTLLIMVGIIIFTARNIEKEAARKLVVSIGIGSSVLFIGAIMHLLEDDINPPISGIVMVGTFILLTVIASAQD